MFIMSVNINCCLEDPRLFKTHHGAIDAMFEVLDGYAENCCSYAATTYDGYDGCEVNINNMDEIEVEE